MPYCEENENASKHFVKKLEAFTNHRYGITVKWITRNVKSLFKVKSRNLGPSCVMYRSKCPYGEEYTGETERNVEKRSNEHKNPTENIETARHLSNNISNLFAWEILMPAPKDKQTHKNFEAFFIAVQKLSLNEQVKSNVLHFFSKQHHMTILIFLMTFYFIFYLIAILVCCCVNKTS